MVTTRGRPSASTACWAARSPPQLWCKSNYALDFASSFRSSRARCATIFTTRSSVERSRPASPGRSRSSKASRRAFKSLSGMFQVPPAWWRNTWQASFKMAPTRALMEASPRSYSTSVHRGSESRRIVIRTGRVPFGSKGETQRFVKRSRPFEIAARKEHEGTVSHWAYGVPNTRTTIGLARCHPLGR